MCLFMIGRVWDVSISDVLRSDKGFGNYEVFEDLNDYSIFEFETLRIEKLRWLPCSLCM